MRLTLVILSAVVALAASEDANLTYTVYAAESAWLGLTTDERIKIPIYKVKYCIIKMTEMAPFGVA